MVEYPQNPRISEVVAGESEVQGYPQLHSESSQPGLHKTLS